MKGIVTVGKVRYENILPDWEQEFDADYVGALLAKPVLMEKRWIFRSFWAEYILPCGY